MKLDARLKGGLAWTGLFVVLAVPSADILFGGRERAPASTSAVASIETTAPTRVVPALKLPARPGTAAAATEVAVSADPVDSFVKSGKKLPDYISDGDAAPVAVTAPTAPAAIAPAATDPIEVASLPREVPVPLPRTARPVVPVAATTPTPAQQAPLIVDEQQVARNTPLAPFPPSDVPVVDGDQLEEWDSGSLADYLERNGLLANDEAASEPVSGEYDPDGFFLDEGPNRSRVRRLDDEGFFLF
jgi:hypothetical protein